jgi:hypothetical protein
MFSSYFKGGLVTLTLNLKNLPKSNKPKIFELIPLPNGISTELYPPEPSWRMHEGVKPVFYSFS